MLLSRYGSGFNLIMEMDYELGCEYIKTALETHQEDRVWLRWINGYQGELKYDEFKEKIGVVKQTQDNRTQENILCEVKNILDVNRTVREEVK